jgi:E3 ubiquitin-protein ligase MARCH6
MPVRVPLTQSPVFFLWQDWALGAMYTKITIALTFMGPDWWLKAAIEQLYQVLVSPLHLNLGRLVKKETRCVKKQKTLA